MNVRTLFASLALTLCPALALAGPGDDLPPAAQTPRDVDLVVCLDTSGSMSGLIDATRQRIWDICSLIAQARPEPRLRVALLSYGGAANGEQGFVVLQQGFTAELDLVYEKLMALQTNGGTELVGRAIHESLNQLDWAQDAGALKLMFLAGNESADQDPQHPFRDQCQRALQQNVVINAIYCGGANDGDAATWRDVARFGGGEFATIDHDNGTVNVVTPYDEQLAKLGEQLNTTYVPYGARGREAQANQERQDANARELSSWAGASRAVCKAGSSYRNGGWDLVDAWRAEGFAWDQVDNADLPESLRELSADARDAHLRGLVEQRTRIQREIQALSESRQAFIKEALAKQSQETSLDFAMTRAIRAQAEAAGFSFE